MARYPYAHVCVGPEEVELVSLALWELGASGVEERDQGTLNPPDASARVTLVASFESEAQARDAVQALGARHQARLAFVEGDAWREAYKAYFKPTRVGERLVVRPSWEAYAPRPGEVVLTLDPGGAFGTGTHETTRLVLEALQPFVRPGIEVLDVGCGSGILSIACLLLGAARARALDVDEEAVRVARDNARHNGVEARLEVSSDALESLTARYPLVLANIESRVLQPLAPALCARLAPGGVLILSGLLAPERERMRGAYVQLELLAAREQGEWLALLLRKPGDER